MYLLPSSLFTYFTALLAQFSSSPHNQTSSSTTTVTYDTTAIATGTRSEEVRWGGELKFELRQYHTVTEDARVLFRDHRVGDTAERDRDGGEELQQDGAGHTISTRTRKTVVHRPRRRHRHSRSPLEDSRDDYDVYSNARGQRPFFGSRPSPSPSPLLSAADSSSDSGSGEELELDGGWDEDEVEAPDVDDRETLLALAKMTNNAYLEPNETGWYDLGGRWNVSYPFGWDPTADGFRGHVFATPDNSTVVVSIKGTSAALFGGGGPTARKDKLNDNLLFSCCCARVDWTWTTVCGCYRGGWNCDEGCLEEAMKEEGLFYPVGTNLYNNITYMYPDANIWMVGHSLGGALASLLGITFGVPAVAFESPGERLAASRLHLPSPPSLHHVTHVYHTADPIAMGTCNGVLSSCALGGYALETRCHLGKSIIYDTVSNLSWPVDIRLHTIVTVIEKLLSQPWEASQKAGREVPEAKAEQECVECYSWEFGDFPAKKLAPSSESQCTSRGGSIANTSLRIP